MATSQRDYYELLGVSRAADESEIKKAFRGLARTLHPDVSNEPDAEERFREVVEAYEVLSKPETRQLYDRYGHEGLRHDRALTVSRDCHTGSLRKRGGVRGLPASFVWSRVRRLAARAAA